MKILMMRITRDIAGDASEPQINQCASEIYNFFVKNRRIAQADLAAIIRR